MKKVYFVRHGESEYNAKRLHQHGDVSLSESGVKQAEEIAERFLDISVDVIISSPYLRAKQTAEAISKRINKNIEFEKKIVELVRPSIFVGKNYDDKSIEFIKKYIKENEHNPEWRYADEENFFDIKNRALEFLLELSRRDESEILVVTHGHFLRVIIGCMMFGDGFSPKEFAYLEHFLVIKNTGLTLCEYGKNGWKLVTWNDHAHLG